MREKYAVRLIPGRMVYSRALLCNGTALSLLPIRSICSRNSFFFVRTCDSSSSRLDKLFCLLILFIPFFILLCNWFVCLSCTISTLWALCGAAIGFLEVTLNNLMKAIDKKHNMCYYLNISYERTIIEMKIYSVLDRSEERPCRERV